MYRYSSIDQLAAALRQRAISAPEIAAEAVQLLRSVGTRYNGVANLLPERAGAEAMQADRRLEERDSGLLCGIPYGVKDLFAATGGPTTYGSRAFENQVFEYDASVIKRLASCGGVLVAKLAMSELAGGGRPHQPGASVHGSGMNPWDRLRYSGGSSSGSGIAVALGLVPFALGTETGGSIVGPAAYSGVTGLRPTHGVLAREGVMTLSRTLDKVGILARSARDVWIVFGALTGSDVKADSLLVDGESGTPQSGTFAFSEREFEEVEPDIRKAFISGIEEFRSLGLTEVNTEVARSQAFTDAVEVIVRVEGAHEFRELLEESSFTMSDRTQHDSLKTGLLVPAVDYLQAAEDVVHEAKTEFQRLFADVDFIVSASRTDAAPLLSEKRGSRNPKKMSDLLRAASNLAGLPGVSFPCGFSDDGLPVAIHIVGQPGSERRLLSVVEDYQSRFAHHLQRPPPDPSRT